jgi:Cu2+-exporting ATPase
VTCCAPGSEAAADTAGRLPSEDELRFAARSLGDGRRQIELSVPAVHCAACIQTVERALCRLPGVERARVNLSIRRVSVVWRGETIPPIVDTLVSVGYPPHLFDDAEGGRDGTLFELLVAVGVSGFAAGNIMLLSVSVWSGAEGATRDLFHWVSALIALPALVFAGRIYFRSAWSALRHGRMNMDVPIAIGVSLAYGMSLYETLTHGPHAYFDASATLLFFLLIGRTLDHVMRNRARTAVMGLARMIPRGAMTVAPDGGREFRPLDEIEPGTRLLIAAGDRVPLDVRIVEGASQGDASLVTGESEPIALTAGMDVRAGTLNLTGPLTVEAIKPADQSFLADMVRMMEAAEGGRARYRRIAERVSALYAPVVHLTALVTFLGWMMVGGDWHRSLTIAIAVLIITCPCALGLAVPIVQVVAGRRLFENGIMMRDGSALERLAEADAVVLDKTGTLTLGRPRLVGWERLPPDLLDMAASLAAQSNHPASRAIVEAAPGARTVRFEDVREIAGLGIEGRAEGSTWRLGRAGWAGEGDVSGSTVFGRDGLALAGFRFEDRLRPGAKEAVRALQKHFGTVRILSGDTAAACAQVAEALGIEDVESGLLPADKVRRVEELGAAGHKVLMVGDGLNDAPALTAAHVSVAPASGADVGRNAADLVFLRDSLSAVPEAIGIALRADRLIRENLAIAVVYNVIAVPVAILGYVTPLVAAVAMSASSILVIANALRLARTGSAKTAPATVTPPLAGAVRP